MTYNYNKLNFIISSIFFVATLASLTRASAQCGANGNVTISSSTTINQYSAVTANISVGATTVQVDDINDLDDPTNLQVDNQIMVIQMQGATINTTNTANYGKISAIGSAGFYEIKKVTSIFGNTITVQTAFGNAYDAAGKVQVVRIPQYQNLTIGATGEIIAAAWDGSTGGIVAMQVSDTLNILGDIEATAQGFRGGNLPTVTNTHVGIGAVLVTDFVTTNRNRGGEKGESIAGLPSTLAGGMYGRGAPANGGGGGNNHNAGGGGGSNAGDTINWSGQGVMCLTCTGTAAWALDPAYAANGNAKTNSSGGGRGGYTYGSANRDALTVGPGDANWGGDQRDAVGGYGGYPLSSFILSNNRLFLGGGGGAGHGNELENADGGGNGGGIVYIEAAVIKGEGRIVSNGGKGGDTKNPTQNLGLNTDAASGGGGGGSILIKANLILDSLTVHAKGGNGGSQVFTGPGSNESEGPGGGGGGGTIAMPTCAKCKILALGGDNGITQSPGLTEFPANGATSGGNGEIVVSGTGTACSDLLPLDLLRFTASKYNETQADLEWETAYEEGDILFEVQQSTDGVHFDQTLATLFNLHQASVYRYQTEKLLPGTNYFRLKMTDNEDIVTYSNLAAIQIDGVEDEFRMYPTQWLSNVTSFNIQSPVEDEVVLEMISTDGRSGKILYKGKLESNKVNRINIDVSDMAAGVYYIRVKGTKLNFIRPVVL